MSQLSQALTDLGETFQRAVGEIGQTVRALELAARADDKTPLLNGLALNNDGGQVGSQDGPDVVVFGDLNRFKALNDMHSHAAGDAAISQVGNMVQTLLVKGCKGQGYRRSGDEFVILLRREALPNFRKSAAAFAHCSFHFNGKALATSMSFGFTVADGTADWFELEKRAEVACLAAKKQGDGACIEWSAAIQQESTINRRFRCVCGVQFSCDLSSSAAPASFVCPCCRQEQPVAEPVPETAPAETTTN